MQLDATKSKADSKSFFPLCPICIGPIVVQSYQLKKAQN